MTLALSPLQGAAGDVVEVTTPPGNTPTRCLLVDIAGGGGGTPSDATPIDVDAAPGAPGVSVEYSRGDHKHDAATAAPVALAAGAGNSEGVAVTLARSDHRHAVLVSLPVNVDKSANAEGVLGNVARADHKHDVSTAAPAGVAVQIGNVAAEGVATTLARSDHTHTVTGGVPVATGTVNAAGAAVTFARADHVHQTAGSTSMPNQSSVAGANVTDALNQLLSNALESVKTIGGSDFDDPISDWAVNVPAALVADSSNAMISVRRFDAAIVEGVGFDGAIPAGSTAITFGFIYRAQTLPAGAVAAQLQLFRRQIPNNAAMPAWSAGLNLALLPIPANSNWQYASQTITLATLGLTAGLNAFLELTRVGAAVGDTLIGDFTLYAMTILVQ